MMLLPGDKMPAAFWHISAANAAKHVDCTPDGIRAHCGAACCTGNVFWPPKASGTGTCSKLGSDGCMLGSDRPVTCLLYPFRLVGNHLVLHLHANVYCKGCYKSGERTIAENNRAAFAILFGEDQADIIIQNARAGKDTTVGVSAEIVAELKAETEWERANAPARTRREMLSSEPPKGNPLRVLNG